jgi:hypothetical protein
VGNDPVNVTDPSGLCETRIEGRESAGCSGETVLANIEQKANEADAAGRQAVAQVVRAANQFAAAVTREVNMVLNDIPEILEDPIGAFESVSAAFPAAGAGKLAGKGLQAVAKKAPDFVVTPRGEAIRVPTGASGPSTTRSAGVQYVGGAGGKGLNNRVTGVRIMEGNTNQGPRVVYMNRTGQTVDPVSGRTLSHSDPRAHHYLEPWK